MSVKPYTEEEKKKVREASASLQEHVDSLNSESVFVGSAYGLTGANRDGPVSWFLIVYSDGSPEFPEEWEGYQVVKRDIPVALNLVDDNG